MQLQAAPGFRKQNYGSGRSEDDKDGIICQREGREIPSGVGSVWRAQEFPLLSLNHWSETWLLG